MTEEGRPGPRPPRPKEVPSALALVFLGWVLVGYVAVLPYAVSGSHPLVAVVLWGLVGLRLLARCLRA